MCLNSVIDFVAITYIYIAWSNEFIILVLDFFVLAMRSAVMKPSIHFIFDVDRHCSIIL